MACQRPPEEEHIEDGRRLLVLLMNAIDTLCLDSHFRVEPFLALPHLAQEAHSLL